jgi:hypothetical protein
MQFSMDVAQQQQVAMQDQQRFEDDREDALITA